jgi:hypothetical protein
MPLRAIDGQRTYPIDEFHVRDETGELRITLSRLDTGKVKIWFQRKDESAGSGEAPLADVIDALQHLLLYGASSEAVPEKPAPDTSLAFRVEAVLKSFQEQLKDHTRSSMVASKTTGNESYLVWSILPGTLKLTLELLLELALSGTVGSEPENLLPDLKKADYFKVRDRATEDATGVLAVHYDSIGRLLYYMLRDGEIVGSGPSPEKADESAREHLTNKKR